MAASGNNEATLFVPPVRPARPPWDPADGCGEEAPWREDRARQREAQSQRQRCADFLKRLLVTGPRAAGECKRPCAEAGFRPRTAERAARRLGVVVCPHVTHSGHAYEWKLPAGERGEQAATGEPSKG